MLWVELMTAPEKKKKGAEGGVYPPHTLVQLLIKALQFYKSNTKPE